MSDRRADMVRILESLWPKNKAKGLLAQTMFYGDVKKEIFGTGINEKIIPGCWLLAPKESDFYKFRFCFFIHPCVIDSERHSISPREVFGERYRPFHAIAEFMNNTGIGVAYVIPTTEGCLLPLEQLGRGEFDVIRWRLFNFQNGNFIGKDPMEFFERWPGGRGRPSHGGQWEPQTREKILNLEEEILTELLLNEIFYSGFIKSCLRKPINDPYDVDSFLISLSQRNIFPMEMKEKFPGGDNDNRFFGIDAGRVMMFLRICIPNDSNAIYLIRELDEDGNFIGWKYITLTDIIMTASWNLQAGGPGMGGQSTQTIRLPYSYFRNFTSDVMSEDNLRKIGNMPKDIKTLAKTFSAELENRFNSQD